MSQVQLGRVDKETISKRLCAVCCGKTYIQNGVEHWYRNPLNPEQFICGKCCARLYYRKKYSPKKPYSKWNHKHECYCCESTVSRKWNMNRDEEGNVLCDSCLKHLYRDDNHIRCTRVLRLRYRAALHDILGWICIKCKYSEDVRALQFDHINGDAIMDRKRFGSLQAAIAYYVHHTDEARQKLQVLCANCNTIKKFDEGLASGKARKMWI